MEENEPKTKAIERLKTDLGVDDNKATGLIEDAVILVLDYTNQDKMLDSMWLYVRQLATITFNREGNEGEASRAEGGVSQSFVEDIPLNIKHSLNRYRIGKVVSYYAPKRT